MDMSENNTNTGKYKLISGKNNTFFANNRMMEGSSIPTEGTFQTGDIIVNNGPTAVEEPMWICNEGGTPGKWGPVSSTSTTIMPNYASMLQSNAVVGSLFYVISDESDESNNPGFYIITSVKEDENGRKIPATWDKINKKDKSVPTLSYHPSMPEGTKIYLKDDEDLIIKFNFMADTYGDGKYLVKRGGSVMKSWTGPKGDVIVNLGRITTDGSYEITVSASDYLTIPATETLTFKVIVGGLKLTSTFDETLLTAIYEEGDSIEFPYAASLADASANMKLNIKIIDETTSNHQMVIDETTVLEGSYAENIWTSPALPNRGLYRLIAQAYTGESVEDTTDGVFTSNRLEYTFRVLKENEIAIIDESKDQQVDTNMYFSVPFRVVSKIANYFIMRGDLYRDNLGTWEKVASTAEAGISSRVNVTNYWSIGKLEKGIYKYVIYATTVDGGVRSELPDPEKTFEVIVSSYQKVLHIDNPNLIAYFDANTKRNNDGSPEIWQNSSKHTGDKYRILLHGLNYSSNGWKHIDESLTDEDDGEMMLKFTGESYGELVQVTNGQARPYSPLSIFSMGGQQGFTFETAIRTRNIGEENARVVTCMKNADLTKPDPGVAISYNTMAISSDSQINKLEFVEDEWVHITLVVDKNIRSLDFVGQANIEDANPIPTLRVYINGVLCSCTKLTELDKFLDGSNQAHPLILNACKVVDSGGNVSFNNFGECEIKFIRIYNTYLKSSEVLQNYISHIYDDAEQQRLDDKNKPEKMTMPTIVFKRKPDKGNAYFATLHGIKDKATSKKTFVDCVMEYNDGEGNTTIFDNTDVYLQGTSSLQYPVKNYKIKTWVDQEKTSKYKFAPPNAPEWTEDNCYTLKCDYMEQSHKNNTPTARFYNQVIDELGGESPAKRDGYHDGIDGFPCIVYYNEGESDSQNVLVGSFMFNIDKEGKELGFECKLYDKQGNVIGSGKDSCISYEATANASDTAGCFYKLEESIENVYKYYLEDSYKEYLEKYGLTSEKCTMEQFKAGIADGTISYLTYEEFIADYDETDYIMNDFEARYSFNEDDEKATYKPMIDLVNWVSDSIEAGTFKKDFEAHLDLTYTIAYYLQMQVFTQVDNCGKNSMWDTWDGVKFYPRPYDMDTQMGLSNTGTEIIRVDSEILIDMSPTKAEGTFAGSEHIDTTTDLRYMNYNTRTSKLWNAFAEEFKEEIKKAYHQLRRKVYTYDNIIKTIWADTDDVIGEIYFNKDAVSKYLSQTVDGDDTYLQMLHGNRAQKYKKFLKERIIFLDTIYEYNESAEQTDTLNTEIGLRSDAAYGQGEGTTVRCYLGISTYSPQYVTVNVGSGADGVVTAYVGPESRYKDPDTGIEHEGTLFSFPIRGINKEFRITGAANIKRINRIQSMNLTEARIEKAYKLLELDVSYSNRMAGLKVGNNTYLRSLNCTNSYLLGTATESQSLDLSNCKNLKTVDLSYTKFTGVTFPQDTVLNVVNLTGSSVQNISIDGAEFLDEIKITGCDNINKFELNRCNRISSIDVAGSTIQNFIATNCDKVTSVNLSNCKSIANFDVTNSYNIETLNMRGNTSPVMQDLKLYSMYNLKKLIVAETTSAHTIRLPKYLNALEANKAANGQPALEWNTLEHLDLSSSSIKKIQYGSADVIDEVVDMKQLNNLTYLSFNSATDMTEVRDLYYVGKVESLFYSCKNLKKVTGTIENTTSSIKQLFYSCYRLENIDGLNLNFVGVTHANYMCDRCFRLKTPMLKKILKACGETLIDITGMCHMHGEDGLVGILGTAEDTTTQIPGNLFEYNTQIQNAYNAFDITGYESISGELFEPCADTINNLQYTFSRMPNLTTVGSTLLHNKPNLNNVSLTFASCGKLKDFINDNPNIFIGSPRITTTSAMFSGCYELATGPDGFGDMMKPLINLTNCAYMFFDCQRNLTAEIPDGFLSKNTNLVKMDGMFQRCRKLPRLPRSLFRENVGDIHIKFNSLKRAVGVFAECNSMEGEVDSTFFLGAEKLVNVGFYAEDNYPWSVNKYPNEGFFQNTKITGYHETFLNPLKEVTNVSGMFRNCALLEDCLYYVSGSEVGKRGNGVTSTLLETCTKLNNTEYMFAGCTQLDGHIPSDIFDSCRNILQNISAMFMSCSSLNGLNQDAKGNEKVDTGVSSDWIKGATNLTTANNFLDGCSSFIGTIPEDLFEGCTKLQSISGFFSGCKTLEGGVPLGLFNSCRETIQNVSYLFNGCELLDQELPEGEYSTERGIVSYTMVSKDTEGALQVVAEMIDPYTQVSYADVVALSPDLATKINANGNYYVIADEGDVVKVITPGLLSECTQLTTIAFMFQGCKKIPGAIPNDLLFTSKYATKYNRLTTIQGLFKNCQSINKCYVEEETQKTYICSPSLFEKCTAVTNCAEVFNRMYKVPANCEIHPRTFDKQTKVTTVDSLFFGTPVTGGITTLFANSINTLVNANLMFARTNITSVGGTFLCSSGVNKKLRQVKAIFGYCTQLQGTSPEFWNGAKFTAMGGNENDYWGALHGCTQLSNYNAAKNKSNNWVEDPKVYI